jgi:hypothetical protein
LIDAVHFPHVAANHVSTRVHVIVRRRIVAVKVCVFGGMHEAFSKTAEAVPGRVRRLVRGHAKKEGQQLLRLDVTQERFRVGLSVRFDWQLKLKKVDSLEAVKLFSQ